MKYAGQVVNTIVLLFSVVVFVCGGCRDDGCDRLYKRNKECAAEFAELIKSDARARMEKTMEMADDEETKKDMKKAMDGELENVAEVVQSTMASEAFLSECRKHWNSKKKEHLEKKKKLLQCLGKNDCSAYVECFMAVVLIGRE